jgi:tetratricopeptide (TPR) repeat protein
VRDRDESRAEPDRVESLPSAPATLARGQSERAVDRRAICLVSLAPEQETVQIASLAVGATGQRSASLLASSPMSCAIEDAINRDEWKRARKLIVAELRNAPDHHWLLARLSLTYYEEFHYARALTFAQQAYESMPRCPLVTWELAGTLHMLKRQREAIKLYTRLVRRGVEAIAYGACGEGIASARGTVADCWYRLAQCHRELGHRARALRCYQQHLAMRGPGCRSIYPVREVRRELRELVA